MTEYHDYIENTTNTCKTCKHIHDLHKDEEGQIEDYHPIVENKKHNKTKKRTARDATLADLARGAKLRTKPGPPPSSQLDWYEVADSESDNSPSASKSSNESSKSNSRKSNKSASSKSNSRKKKRTARDATLSDFARGANLRAKPGFYASQLDAFEVVDSESDNSRSKDSSYKGGKNKSKKNKSKNNKRTMKK